MATSQYGKPPVITNKIRNDWNNYVNFLDSIGKKGSPELDKGGYGNLLLNTYIKNHPDTSLTPDIVKPIQAEFANYRNFALDQVKQGKYKLADGVTPDNFMVELSKLDNYPGSLTTRHVFPQEYMRYVDMQNNTDSTVNKGYAMAK